MLLGFHYFTLAEKLSSKFKIKLVLGDRDIFLLHQEISQSKKIVKSKEKKFLLIL
jgi:hypothetical protein